MHTPTNEQLDMATIWLIFAMRDSLTQAGPDGLKFWGERAIAAIETGAAGSDNAGQAITTMCRKLQIPTLGKTGSEMAVEAIAIIDADYASWQRRIQQNIISIFALARAQNTIAQEAKKAGK